MPNLATKKSVEHEAPEPISHAASNSYTITLDDDPMVQPIIEHIVGVKSVPFRSAKQLLAQAEKFKPMAAFLDIHLSTEESSLDMLPTLRKLWPSVPLLVITADQSGEAVSEALASGADDFIRKPLDPLEVNARLQARMGEKLRLSRKNTIQLGEISLNKEYRLLRGELGERFLSQTITNLLQTFFEAQGTVIPRKSLKKKIWGETHISDNALDRKVCELRAILRDTTNTLTIRTVYGQGFSLSSKTFGD